MIYDEEHNGSRRGERRSGSTACGRGEAERVDGDDSAEEFVEEIVCRVRMSVDRKHGMTRYCLILERAPS